jgi:hypothetical protein
MWTTMMGEAAVILMMCQDLIIIRDIMGIPLEVYVDPVVAMPDSSTNCDHKHVLP